MSGQKAQTQPRTFWQKVGDVFRSPGFHWALLMILAIFLALAVGINTAAQPLSLLLGGFPLAICVGLTALATVHWGLLYGKDIIDWFKSLLTKRKGAEDSEFSFSDVSDEEPEQDESIPYWKRPEFQGASWSKKIFGSIAWLYLRASNTLGIVNAFVNGFGVLSGAIGLLMTIQGLVGAGTLLALPLGLRILQGISGFGGGFFAALTLTRNAIVDNAKKLFHFLTTPQPQQSGWERGRKIFVVAAGILAAFGLSAFNAMAGHAAVNALFVLFGLNLHLPALALTIIATSLQVICGLMTLIAASSFFISFALNPDGRKSVGSKVRGFIQFIVLGGLPCAATGYMIFAAIALDPISPWVMLMGPTGAMVFGIIIAVCSAYLLYRLFDYSSQNIVNFFAGIAKKCFPAWFERTFEASVTADNAAEPAASIADGIKGSAKDADANDGFAVVREGAEEWDELLRVPSVSANA